MRRGGSRGFVLRDETVDEDFLKASLEAEQKWLGKFKHTQQPVLQRKDTNNSSKYSFSTEYSSGDYNYYLFIYYLFFHDKINKYHYTQIFAQNWKKSTSNCQSGWMIQ